MSKNPYEILHLEEDATYDEIKERYRHLTRSLHPDKQPLENYQITKRLFEQIDEAYKSISSPLRRYLFREYGLPALKILEEVPEYFEEFDVDLFTVEQTKKLKQLMVYLLYERQASFQTDKTKFITRMVMNISKTLKGRPKNMKKSSKRNHSIPEIENCTFEYEMVLPEFIGFTNTFAVSQSTTNIKTDPKYSLNFAFSLARRIYQNYMMAIQFNISTEESNFSFGINRVYQNNLVLHFTPLAFTNWKLTAPKISIEKSLQDYQVSAALDFSGGINIEYSESTQKRIGKSLKLYMESNSIGIIPKIEVQMSEFLKFFAQLSAGIESQGKEGLNIRPAFTYGYRLIITEELKLELSSSIGASNYLQVSFISGKFRVGIPLITGDVDLVRFQVIKVATMALTYLAIEAGKQKVKRDDRMRQKLFKENQTRLNDLKRELNRALNDVELTAEVKRQKQIKYNGLIIIRAIFGEQNKIAKIAKKLTKLKFSYKPETFEREIADLEESILSLDLPVGDLRQEAENITTLIQNEVIGGQLINFNLELLKHYNPSIDSGAVPSIFVLYIDRGVLKHKKLKCNQPMNLGTKKFSFSLTKLLSYAIGFLT